MLFRAPVETKAVKHKFKDQKDTGTIPVEDTQPTLLLMKTKVIKCKFEDQEDTGTTSDEDAAADAATDAAPQPPHLMGEQQPPLAGWSLHLPPALPVVLPPAMGAWALQPHRGW
jgi:hypothetical protein